MEPFGDGIKQRRAELLKRLKIGQTDGIQTTYSPHTYSSTYNPPRQSFKDRGLDSLESSAKGKWMWQLVLSLALFLMTFFVFQSNKPLAVKGQAWVKEALNKEYNFSGVQAWYQEYFSGSPAFLPTIAKSPVAVNAPVEALFAPVNGKVIRSFEGQGIAVQTEPEEQVVAMGKGWVTFVGEKGKLGMTVIVSHSGGRESWYSWLGDVAVKKNDVVEGGQFIGRVAKGGDSANKGLLYFSIKEKNQYVDPLGVVQFE